MNLQQAKALVIEEGNVKTIHDKNSQLLWGAVGYGVKYKGDTTQQTYSGKNFAPVWHSNSDVGFSTNGGATRVIGDGIVTVTTSTTQSTSGVYMSKNVVVNQTNYPDLFQEGNVCSFTIIADIESNFRFGSGSTHPTATIGTNPTRLSFQTSNNNVEFYITNKTGATFIISEFQIEKNTSTATSYEPYVGGVASPNPSYSQTVNVVTGTQIVTLSDGAMSQDYIVDLGTTELCKIGDYQDYIYKSGDDWYVHKTVGKSMLGNLNWTTGGTNQSNIYRMQSNGLNGMFVHPTANSVPLTGLCTHYLATRNDEQGTYGCNIGISGARTGDNIFIYTPDYNTSSSADSFKTWLANNNVTFYYVLVAPTDIQITDSTLITQLEAIHEWTTRYGYNATVSGNLPIIIDRTNL